MVGLCQHGLGCLGEDIRLGEISHFLGHIRIPNDGFGCLNIGASCQQVVVGMLQSALDCADGGLLVKSLGKGVVEHLDRSVGTELAGDADGLAILALQCKGIGTHIRQTYLDGLVSLRADLQGDGIVRRGILGTDNLMELVQLGIGRGACLAISVSDGNSDAAKLVI